MAVAALAVSALAATPSAAYAGDLGLNRLVKEASESSSMSWAYYSGEVTDFTTTTPDVFQGARATALMIGMEGGSYFRVQIKDIGETAIGGDYGAHLHTGPCVADDPAAALGHYNNDAYDPDVIAGLRTKVVSDQTEVWLDFEVNSDGNARTSASVPFIPPEGDQYSIVIHAEPTVDHPRENGPAVGSAGPRLACLPLKIQEVTNATG
jgi:Cu-Zn family superoxide dismutase